MPRSRGTREGAASLLIIRYKIRKRKERDAGRASGLLCPERRHETPVGVPHAPGLETGPWLPTFQASWLIPSLCSSVFAPPLTRPMAQGCG